MHLRSYNIRYRISHTSESGCWSCQTEMLYSSCSNRTAAAFLISSFQLIFLKLEAEIEFWTNMCMVNQGENVIK